MLSVDDATHELVLVLEESRSLGFLGPGPVSPQIDHAQAFLDSLEGQGRILDLGSGGEFPDWSWPSPYQLRNLCF